MFNKVKDSGVREEMPTGSRRDTREGKGRYDLLPTFGLHRLACWFEVGARKYAERNWELGQPLARMLDSGIRHAFKYLQGQADEDHLAAAVWNLICVLDTEERVRRGLAPADLDDLPGNPTKIDTSKPSSNLHELRVRLRDSGFCQDPAGSENINPAWLAVCPAYDHSHDAKFTSYQEVHYPNPKAKLQMKQRYKDHRCEACYAHGQESLALKEQPSYPVCSCGAHVAVVRAAIRGDGRSVCYCATCCNPNPSGEALCIRDCAPNSEFVAPPDRTPPPACDCQIFEECNVCRPLPAPAQSFDPADPKNASSDEPPVSALGCGRERSDRETNPDTICQCPLCIARNSAGWKPEMPKNQ